MDPRALAYLTAGFSAAIVILGAAYGIGKIATAALEASGRQPEVAGPARVTMLVGAALIEGATFFALVICIILSLK